MKLRDVKYLSEQNQVVVNDLKKFTTLKLNHYPIPLSFGLLDEYMIVDPTDEEESLLSTSFTIIYNNKGHLCNVYKPGGTILKDEILKKCMDKAKQRTIAIMDMLNEQKKD